MSELASLLAALDQKPEFNLEEICFKEQLAFIQDKSPWVTASCSRRSGKTEVCAFDLINTALKAPGLTCLYITLTRANAERLVWPKMLAVNDFYQLGGVVNISKLSLTFPNGSVIYCSGCKDKSELDKFRGLALKLIYIDEVQSFKSFIRELIDEVLAPTLADYAGSLKLLGTPAPLQTGFFWESLNSNAYSHHHWTFWNNPYISLKSGLPHREILDRELTRRGVSESHPSVRREWFGEWTIDTESLVLHYDKQKNNYEAVPDLSEYVISVDVGHDDADAIAVIGWHEHKKEAYLVEEFVRAQQGVTELADEITRLYQKYNPIKVVMDTGGLGKKIAEELRRRHSLPIVAAEKQRKIEFLALLDDALRRGDFKARESSRFAKDTFIVEWDYDKSTSDRLIIKDEPHSDIVDAVLYGYREALHWLSVEPKKPIKLTTREAWIEFSKQRMDEALEEQIAREQAAEQEADQWATMGEDPEHVMKHYLNKRR